MKTSVLVLAFTDLSIDPRVRRQISALKEDYGLTVVGTHSPGMENVSFIKYHKPIKTNMQKVKSAVMLMIRQYEQHYWSQDIRQLAEELKEKKFDIIIANDIETLPLATYLTERHKETKLILDAHEYAPKEFEDVLYWKLLYGPYRKYQCKQYTSKVDKAMTVCEGIAKEYRKQFALECEVVTNACSYIEMNDIRDVNENQIKMVFHGAATPSRKLENLIRIMELLEDRFYLDLYLVGNESYIEALKKRANGNKNISFKSPVAFKDIHTMLVQYDIGLYLLEPNSFNNKMALPNKLFEFIQARLMIAIGPSPEMKRYVEKYQCGIVAKDFSPQALADVLNQLDVKAIKEYKKKSDEMAHIECAENNREQIINMIKTLQKEENKCVE